MTMIWRGWSVRGRIWLLRQALPVLILLLVALYQLLMVLVRGHFGELERYLGEILFYGVVGALVTWAVLSWIGRWLTEKEEVERRMHRQERYLASITSASAEAIISTDNQGIIQSWNRGARLIFGYGPEEMIGEPLAKLLPSQSELERIREEVQAKGFVRDYETELWAKDGREVPVELSQTLLLGEEGHIIGSSIIIRDITERKQRERAILEERARIARDMHDTIAQNLYFLSLKIDLCRRLLGKDPEQVEGELEAMQGTLQQSLEDVRRAIFALRPIDLERLGFPRALERLARELEEQSGVRAQLSLRGEDELELPPEMEAVLFRVAQEALSNVGKHARAKEVQIELELSPQEVSLKIRDNGCGFSPEALRDSGMGIKNMRERVEEARGRLHLHSEPGRGTEVRAVLPLTR
ncbi:MAG: PAS domain S-box protein [Candidatus Bipolaricaulia bacterium]